MCAQYTHPHPHPTPGHGPGKHTQVWILVVLSAQPARLLSNLEYIATFRSPHRLSGERHYYLVQLQTAAAFIENLDPAALTIEPQGALPAAPMSPSILGSSPEYMDVYSDGWHTPPASHTTPACGVAGRAPLVAVQASCTEEAL